MKHQITLLLLTLLFFVKSDPLCAPTFAGCTDLGCSAKGNGYYCFNCNPQQRTCCACITNSFE